MREGANFTPRWDAFVLRAQISYGLKGHIGNMLQFFNYRLDVLLLNYYLNTTEVGIYSVSTRLAELLWNLPSSVGFVIFPKAAASTPEELQHFTPRVFRITLAMTAIGAIGLAFLGKPLIRIIYDQAFISAYLPLLALLPGVVLIGGAKVLTNEIAGRGYPHYNSINSGLSLILTLLFDLLLIPRYGMLGAAIASSLSYTMVFFLALFFYATANRQSLNTSPQ